MDGDNPWVDFGPTDDGRIGFVIGNEGTPSIECSVATDPGLGTGKLTDLKPKVEVDGGNSLGSVIGWIAAWESGGTDLGENTGGEIADSGVLGPDGKLDFGQKEWEWEAPGGSTIGVGLGGEIDPTDNGLSGTGSIWIGLGPIQVGVTGSTPEVTNDDGDFGSNEWGANVWVGNVGNGVPLFGWGQK